MKKIMLSCVAMWAGLATVAAQPQAGPAHRFDQNDVWLVRTIDLVQISPDGRHILFALSPEQVEGDEELSIFHVATREVERVDFGRQYYFDRRRNHDLVWSRKSDGLLFRVTDETATSFWHWDMSSRQTMKLFERAAGRGSSSGAQFRESADGRRIAYVVSAPSVRADDEARRARAMATTGLVLGANNGWQVGDTIPNEIWMWDRESGEQKKLYTGPVVMDMQWSPDGAKLALNAFTKEKSTIWSLLGAGGISGHGAVVVDIAEGTIRQVRETPLQDDWVLGWSPDGRTLAIDAHTPIEVASSASGILSLETDGGEVSGWTPDAGGVLRRTRPDLMPEKDDVPRTGSYANGGSFHWHRDGTMYFTETVAGRSSVIAVAQPGAGRKRLTDPRWNLSKISFAADADLAAAVREAANDPQELALVDLKTGAIATLTSFNSAVAALQRPAVEPFRVTNRFGYVTDNWIIKPDGYRAGTRYPVVVLLYAFNNAFAAQPWMKCFTPFEYARLGMVVLLANYPNYDGAAGEGRQTIPERWRFGVGVNPLASVEAAVDRLDADGLIDPRRVAIAGFSYGGFLAQYAITHSSKFSAAFVNDGGAWNPSAYYMGGMRDESFTLIFDYMFGGAPYGAGRKAMQEFLPAYGFGRLPVPVLFEGHFGERGLPWIADFYLTGKQEGTPIEAVIYDDKHIMVDRQRQRSSIARSTDWLRYWLLGTENPAPVDADEYRRWAELKKKLAALKH